MESAGYGEKMAVARREMASTSPQTTVKPGQPPAAQPPTTPADTHSDDDEDPPSSGPPATVVRRSFTFADFFDKEVIAARRERIESELDKKEFDKRIEIAKEHFRQHGGGLRARSRKGYCIRDDGFIYRHHGQTKLGGFTMSDHRHGSVTAEAPRNDYGSGVFFPAPTLAISAPYSAPKQQSVFETAGSREDAEKEKDRQRKAADAERVATLLEFDVEFEHAVLYRSLQFAFDDVNPAPALDLTAGSDLIKGNWQTHIGAMVGKETASAVAESLLR